MKQYYLYSILLLIISILFTFVSISSALLNTSSEAYGLGYSAKQTDDDGYVIVGTKYTYYGLDHLKQNVWLIKIDSNGNKVWDKIFGGAQDDVGYSVQQTDDHGFIIAASTESFGAGGKNAWLIKTDARGNEIWNKTFGGQRNDWAHSIRQTNDGGYIVTGSMHSYDTAYLSQMVWLIKTDPNGDRVWERTFGGQSDDWGNSVQQTADGGYIIAGATRSYGKEGNSALWLIKTDDDGNETWDKTFDGPRDAVGNSVQQTIDGGYIISGSKIPFDGRQGEIWLIKTDADGNKIWDDTLGGSGEDLDDSVQQTNDGAYITIGSKWASGEGSQSAWLIKIDEKGNELWDKTFDESGWKEGKSVQQTNDGGYIMTGSTYPYASSSKNSLVWLAKTDQNGNKIWERTFD